MPTRATSLIQEILAAQGVVVDAPCPVELDSTGPAYPLPADLKALVLRWDSRLKRSRELLADGSRNDGGVWWRTAQEAEALLTIIENAIRHKLGFSALAAVRLARNWTFTYDQGDGPLLEAARNLATLKKQRGEMTIVEMRTHAANFVWDSELQARIEDTPLLIAIVLAEAKALEAERAMA